MTQPLPPVRVPWTLKPLDSAEVSETPLAGGRVQYAIRHDVLRGVTPAMLVWWFRNLEGDMMLEGRSVPKYRVWHPVDHVGVSYVRRRPDGSIGPGAAIRIRECFAARPEYGIDVVAEIERLDEGGFAHCERIAGVEVARIDYTFTPVAEGTLYENALTVGLPPGAIRSRLNRWIRPRKFPDEMGRAWLRHNVEEVGAFEAFLPALYESEIGK